jgi:hypothetical protein
MAIEFNDNLHVKINRPTDFRFGPFANIAQANATIPIAQRYHGLIFGVYTTPLNIATSDIKFYYYWDGLTNSDIKELEAKAPVNGSYANQAAMIAAQATQVDQYIYYDGTSYWEYLGTTNGNITDYRRIDNPLTLGFGLSFDLSGNLRLGNLNSNSNYTELDFSIPPSGIYDYNQYVVKAEELNKYLGEYEFYFDRDSTIDYWYIKHDLYTKSNSYITSTKLTETYLYSRSGTAIPGETFAEVIVGASRINQSIPSTGEISIRFNTDFDASSSQKGIRVTDSVYNRGAYYSGDYEANFIARSLVTKQYVDTGLATKQNILTNPVTGTGVSNQVAFWNGTTTQTGDSGLTWNNTTKTLQVTTGSTAGILFAGTRLYEAQNQTTFTQLSVQPSSGNKTGVLQFLPSGTGNQSVLEFFESSNPLDTTKRHVIRNNNSLLQIGGDGASKAIEFISNNVSRMRMFANGNFGFFTTTDAGFLVDINGTARIQNDLTISDTRNIILATGTGTKIGTATDQKLGFWNATPIVQPSGDLLTALQNLGLVASPTLPSDTNKVSYNVADSKNATERNQARVNIGSTSATSQIVSTGGVINDLVITSNHLVVTGANVQITGLVAGLDGQEVTIFNNSGTNVTLVGNSGLSIDVNRIGETITFGNFRIIRIKYRAGSQNRWYTEFFGVSDNRYLRKDITDTKTGDIAFTTDNGTKLGTSTSQKLSLWNATPIVQPTTAIAEAVFVENAGGTVVNVDSTFDGYTLQQAIKALRDMGALA